MNWRKNTDYRVYLVTDRSLCLDRSLEIIATAAAQGGVGIVQLREKNLASRDFLEEAKRLVALLHPLGIPVVINDRVDIALASGAAGVHVGQSDLPAVEARRLLGPNAIVGLSVENREQLKEAENPDIDYVGISPVFSTPTKKDTAPPWGLEGLAWARTNSPLRLVAIGGIHLHNAKDVIAAGADGLAVVSEICSAPNPALATAQLKALFPKSA